MTDDRLRRNLRLVDSPLRPDPAFVEDLHARLAAELGFAQTTEQVLDRRPTRVDRRRHGRTGWWAVLAAVLALTLLALLVGRFGRGPDQSPPPTQPPSSAQPATITPDPSSGPAQATSPAPSLAALRGDGIVVFELADLTEIPTLRVVRADLSTEALLPNVPGVQGRPAWRPDGQALAFVGYDPSQAGAQPLIWETDATGAEPTLVSVDCQPPACAGESEPAYSPDGSRLAFVQTVGSDVDSQRSVLAVRDLTTGDVTPFELTGVPRAEAVVLHPRWSPDGGTIAYGVATFDEFAFANGSAIHLIGADGANDRVLTAPELEAGDPEWSPDGSSIVFSSQPIRVYAAESNRDATAMHLFRIGIDGSGADEYPLEGAVGAPSWTPAGDQILFTFLEGAGDVDPGHGRLYVMDPDGNNVLPVTSTLGTPAWYAVQQPRP
jgi:TolB protein